MPKKKTRKRMPETPIVEEQPKAYKKVKKEEAEVYTKLRNMADATRMSNIRF
jgi:hypothetical protein